MYVISQHTSAPYVFPIQNITQFLLTVWENERKENPFQLNQRSQFIERDSVAYISIYRIKPLVHYNNINTNG